MAVDFPLDEIVIKYKALDLGPWIFDLSPGLPTGTTLSAVTCKSYLGKVDPGDDLSTKTETTSEVIDTVKTVISASYYVHLYVNYPTTAAYQNKKHTLIIEYTLNNAGTDAVYFHFINVRKG